MHARNVGGNAQVGCVTVYVRGWGMEGTSSYMCGVEQAVDAWLRGSDERGTREVKRLCNDA